MKIGESETIKYTMETITYLRTIISNKNAVEEEINRVTKTNNIYCKICSSIIGKKETSNDSSF